MVLQRVDSTQPLAKFGWTKERQDIALLLAESDMSDREIAEHRGVSRESIARWKKHPEFIAKVHENIAAYDARILRKSVARKTARIDGYLDRLRRMRELLEERAIAHGPKATIDTGDGVAVDIGGDGAVGGGTGLVVREIKRFGQSETETHAFDAALMREIRELEKQLAIETGDWQEKQQVSGSISVEYVNDWRAQGEGE